MTTNTATHTHCVLIGSGLSSEDSYDVVIGNPKANFRLKGNGDILVNGKKVSNDKSVYEGLKNAIKAINK